MMAHTLTICALCLLTQRVVSGACFYLSTPPETGFPILEKTDMWLSSLVNSVAEIPDGSRLMWEFSRDYLTPATFEPPPIALWSLDFAVVGDGNT